MEKKKVKICICESGLSNPWLQCLHVDISFGVVLKGNGAYCTGNYNLFIRKTKNKYVILVNLLLGYMMKFDPNSWAERTFTASLHL